MRKDPSCSDRLCVRGSALRPIRPPVSERARWGDRRVRLIPQDPEDASSVATSGRAPETTEKQVLPLHVTNCRSSGVRSALLRKIHETVEVDDFRWLLGKLIKTRELGGRDRLSDALLSRPYIDALHRDLNGHMEVLRNLADAQEDALDQFEATTTTTIG